MATHRHLCRGDTEVPCHSGIPQSRRRHHFHWQCFQATQLHCNLNRQSLYALQLLYHQTRGSHNIPGSMSYLDRLSSLVSWPELNVKLCGTMHRGHSAGEGWWPELLVQWKDLKTGTRLHAVVREILQHHWWLGEHQPEDFEGGRHSCHPQFDHLLAQQQILHRPGQFQLWTGNQISPSECRKHHFLLNLFKI